MRKLENTKLDRIGKALIKDNALSPRDIEKIVADPALFDAVRMRIALADKPPVRRPLIRPLAVAGFAAVAMFSTVLGLVLLSSNSDSNKVAQTQPQTTKAPSQNVTRSSKPDQVVHPTLPPVEDDRVVVQRASTKTNVVRSNRSTQPQAQQIGEEDEFYALSYAGDPHETERGARIIRVDIPRSTLFAMGVDVPLENETETVKADLLVGSDGVTRAIRVVK